MDIDFLYSHHKTVGALTDFEFKLRVQQANKTLPPGYDISLEFLPLAEKEGSDNIAWSDCNSNPGITFFYREIGGQKFLVDFQANPAFLVGWSRGLLVESGYRDFCRSGEFDDAFQDGVKGVKECREAMLKNAKMPRQKNSFSLLEIQSLVSYTWAIASVDTYLISLARAQRSKKVEAEQLKNIEEALVTPIAGFVNLYFAEHPFHAAYCFYKVRVVVVLSIMVVLFWLFCLMTTSGADLLEAELDKRGVTLTRYQVRRLLLRNWGILIFPGLNEELRKKVVSLASELQKQFLASALIRRANAVWNDLSQSGISETEKKALKTSFDLVCAEKKSIATREEHLMLLQRRLSKSAKALPDTVVKESSSPAKRMIRPVSERSVILAEMADCLPNEFQVNPNPPFSIKELRNLEFVFRNLPRLIPNGVGYFLSLENWRVLLRDEDRFLSALRLENQEILRVSLGIKRQSRVTKKKSRTLCLSGKKVVLVGGGKIGPNHKVFCQEILHLGAVECRFISCERENQLKSLGNSKGVDLVVLFCLDIGHNTEELLDSVSKGRLNVAYIHTTNISRFAEELQKRL